MSLITRAKNIILTPASEWLVIDSETETPQSLLGKYVVPMALVPAVAAFIGFGVIGANALFVHYRSFQLGLSMAVSLFVSSIAGYFLSTYVVDALAPSFGSSKNLGKSAQLVAYSYTALWVAGIAYIIPSLSFLLFLSLYGVYICYLGLGPIKSTPEDKKIGYLIVTAIVIIVIAYVVQLIINAIFFQFIGNPFLRGAGL